MVPMRPSQEMYTSVVVQGCLVVTGICVARWICTHCLARLSKILSAEHSWSRLSRKLSEYSAIVSPGTVIFTCGLCLDVHVPHAFLFGPNIVC